MLRKKLRATDGLEFGNSIYKVKFEQKDRCTTFGHKYVFNLEDAIDGCAEYVINMKVLKRFVVSDLTNLSRSRSIAEELGLELIYHKEFHQVFEDDLANQPELDLLYRMSVLNEQGTISNDEWEAIGNFCRFIAYSTNQNRALRCICVQEATDLGGHASDL